ncbi:hypothetical protein G5C60_00785 [Streptomyces sp. HC44]|uniref:Uncharacterized protein n=1 Tax=Streptomyces scabichelini TaxID=2711217 RepID=A0A6G4UXC5_9ACTN|nr:hypothetical protein [Streptomyces scabichelini]NGO06254.1 hypothetical protein [Streptomyces scabichelini]
MKYRGTRDGRRYGVWRKTPHDHRVIASDRATRRTRLLVAAARQAGPTELNHEWLADRTGVPLGYLVWRYPTTADLRALRSLST